MAGLLHPLPPTPRRVCSGVGGGGARKFADRFYVEKRLPTDIFTVRGAWITHTHTHTHTPFNLLNEIGLLQCNYTYTCTLHSFEKSEFWGLPQSNPKSNSQSDFLTQKVTQKCQKVTLGVTFRVNLGETPKVTF